MNATILLAVLMLQDATPPALLAVRGVEVATVESVHRVRGQGGRLVYNGSLDQVIADLEKAQGLRVKAGLGSSSKLKAAIEQAKAARKSQEQMRSNRPRGSGSPKVVKFGVHKPLSAGLSAVHINGVKQVITKR